MRGSKVSFLVGVSHIRTVSLTACSTVIGKVTGLCLVLMFSIFYTCLTYRLVRSCYWYGLSVIRVIPCCWVIHGAWRAVLFMVFISRFLGTRYSTASALTFCVGCALAVSCILLLCGYGL